MTYSPIADLQDTLLPWASTTEARLESEFAEAQLFVELDINGDELERMTRFFGTFISRQVQAGSSESALLEACPAITAATLISRAARFNEVGELGSEYWFGLGLEPTPARRKLIEGRYREILEAAGLNTFDEVTGGPDGELGRLFAHVGVATDWVPELIEVIDSRRLDGSAAGSLSTEVEALVEILAEQPRQVGPLCQTLPETAATLLRPIVATVRYAADNPDGWEYALQAEEVEGAEEFPALIREDVVEELRERPAGTLARRHSVGVARKEDQPRFHLDVERKRVVLRLPAQPLAEEDGAEIRWRVDFDGRPGAFRAMRSDNPARVESEVVDVPVRNPLREVRVRSKASDHHWHLPLVNSATDPVLVFTLRGHDVSDHVCLHHSEVYVVCPQDSVAKDPIRNEIVPVLSEQGMKTWAGWVIRELDLSEALALHLERPGEPQPSMLGVRAVDPRQRVRFIEPDEALPAVRTLADKAIHSMSLMVEFPPTVSGATEEWFLSVSAYAGPGEVGEEVSEEQPLEVPAEGGAFDVFDPEAYDSPWVGEYLVRLRGPRNESFRHEYALVEGMDVEVEIEGPSSQTRLPMRGGLSPATVRLLPGEKPFLRVKPITLGAEQSYTLVSVETDAGDALPVVVRPPWIRYQLTMHGEDPMWRTEPIQIAAAWLNTDSRFRVRPGAPMEDPRFVIRDRHGNPVRTLALTTVDEVTWFVDLATVASSIGLLTQGSFEFEFVDPIAARRVSVRLANVVSDGQWGVEIEEGRLQVNSEMPGQLDTMGAWVWPLTAPWESARFVDCGGALPEDLVEAGPLSVQLFHQDRFSHLRPPVVAGERSVKVEAPGFFAGDDADSPWAQLSAFLAGEREEIPTDSSVLSTLWDVQAGWLAGRFAVMDKLREALTHDPRASIGEMSRSLVPASDRPAQFIASGLVHTPMAGGEGAQAHSDVDRHGDTPWIAALEILDELSRIDDELVEARKLRAELGDVAGAPLVQTVETGRDVSLDTACIDNTTVQIAHMDPVQQKAVLDMFFGGAGVVPGALSEENSRLIAVFETFKKRQELSDLLGDPQLMKTAVAVLRRVKSANRQLYLSARVRFDRLSGVDTDTPANRWALAPVVSMIFALATRMHAHGHLSSLGQLPQAYAGWADMARLVPDLVTGDIVSADAMVLGIFGPQVGD
ncbi:hypothetical protein CRES_1290 [Corynebacterium resistens DSM 45100]|uniref:Uncharacterized protein n=1 Tax=Corynebacterium resistens (strain DSM 45100 / JCM 12819 / GTC 2026 / SICGH 158) TaxID=662755 RepID=F8DYI0_CORRG|nr:hypothetical protein [Corynebacterium resistens]AEI09645.1 hypothetical protein CRES_1290 [Corynebacterium resistens DSM 45100]